MSILSASYIFASVLPVQQILYPSHLYSYVSILQTTIAVKLSVR
jgi:hypothetical protein